MKRFLPFLFLFASTLTVLAQTDSVAIVNANWQQKKLAKGVNWEYVHFNQNDLFNANQWISIVKIAPGSKSVKLTMAYSDSLERTSIIAKNHKAIAAINGSFFKMRGADPDYDPNLKGVPKLEPSKLPYNRSVVYLKVKDSLIAGGTFAKDSLRRRNQQGVIAIKDNILQILTTDVKNIHWEKTLKANDIMATGPMLLLNGRDFPISLNDSFSTARHPRTAVGKKADGTVILFVVDGRAKESAGMSIFELQKVMRWLGCVDAINLDGGGSTAMYIKDQPENGVVSHPSDNKLFDHKGEREVANAVLVLAN